jgi:hypothetical protein
MGAFDWLSLGLLMYIGFYYLFDIILVFVLQPGKGNFVVKVSGCEKPIVELLGMKRPFPALKELDMEVVTAQVLKALDS